MKEKTNPANPGIGASFRGKDASLASSDSEAKEEDVPFDSKFQSLQVWFIS